MLLSKPQLSRFWRDWSRACENQSWTLRDGLTPAQINSLRHDLLKRAGFDSLTLVDRGPGFDRVLAELGLLNANLDRTAETLPGNTAGDRRRLLWLIRKHSHPLGGEPYVLALARDKFHLTQGLATIEDLSDDQLTQLMMTLNARARQYRRKNASLTSEETFPDEIEFAPSTTVPDHEALCEDPF